MDYATQALERLKAAVDGVRLARSSGDEVLELAAMAELDEAWKNLPKYHEAKAS